MFFGQRDKADFGDDFDPVDDKAKTYDDEGLYEDVDVTNADWRLLDVIHEETDSEYYKSLDYCNVKFQPDKFVTLDEIINQSKNYQKEMSTQDINTVLENCKEYLDTDGKPKLQPKETIADKIYNFKKDFSSHEYANVDCHNYENVDFDRRTKNDLLRERFFLSNQGDAKLNNDKKIECHSIINDVTKSGPSVKVTGALNMKLLNNLDKYNRVLTTSETFMESAVASFTKTELTRMRGDDLENFVKRSEKYFTTESKERHTEVLNNAMPTDDKGKTEVRIFYNPTFRATGKKIVRGFCQFCYKRCPRSDLKCCNRCVCLELELKNIWRENWLNILCVLGLLFMLVAVFVQYVWPTDQCDSTEVDGQCFEMMG